MNIIFKILLARFAYLICTSLLSWTLYVGIRPWKVSSDHQSNLDCTKFASRILFSGLCSPKGLEHVEKYWRTARKLKPSAFPIRILWLVVILEEFNFLIQNYLRGNSIFLISHSFRFFQEFRPEFRQKDSW